MSRVSRGSQQADNRVMSAVLWDRSGEGLPLLPGEEGQPIANTVAGTLIGLAMQADRKDRDQLPLYRRLTRGERERGLRAARGFVLRATVDGVPTAILDYRVGPGGTRLLVGGTDQNGEFGVTFRRSADIHGDLLLRSEPRSYQVDSALVSDGILFEHNPSNDQRWGSVVERLGALGSALRRPDAVIGVEVMAPDPRDLGLRDSLYRHLTPLAPVPVA